MSSSVTVTVVIIAVTVTVVIIVVAAVTTVVIILFNDGDVVPWPRHALQERATEECQEPHHGTGFLGTSFTTCGPCVWGVSILIKHRAGLYEVLDGWHRVHAHRREGRKWILIHVMIG
jgi:hypothetical protein